MSPETLYYYRARYPSVGRFLSEDPLQFSGDGVVFYRYGKNNPTTLTDPFGMNTGTLTWPEWVLPGVEDAGGTVIGVGARILGGAVTAVLQLSIFAKATARDEDMVKDLPKPSETCPRPNDPCKGLRDILRDHLLKLADYASNPQGHDNVGILGKGRDEIIIQGPHQEPSQSNQEFHKIAEKVRGR